MERKKKYKVTLDNKKSMELAEILKGLRAKEGISIRGLAEECNLAAMTMLDFEHGKKASVDVVERIANHYGLTLALTFLPKEKPQPTLNEQDADKQAPQNDAETKLTTKRKDA